MFDNYTLKARFYPVIILFSPIIVIGVFYSFQFESIIMLLSSLGFLGALTYLFSQLGRDRGYHKQTYLWNSWGGAPTIQILRFRDAHIDQHTKKRYHQKLQSLCPVDSLPDKSYEELNPAIADEVYQTWTKFMISKTRDVKSFPLLLKDNTSYGFRRNLWGLKSIGLALCISLLISNYLFWLIKTKKSNPFLLPESFIYSTIALTIILSFWIVIVNSKWVKVPAFSYAERLFETLETL
jgi:hypothetical protein